MIVLIPTCDTITAPQMAKNFCDHIWKQIISDRGTQYAAQFMKDLHKLTNTTTNISTAYYPQTDGQTERINQEIKQYLHLFINYRQIDWNQWLSCAEFAYNNKVQTSTGFSPFYVNRHPHTNVSVAKDQKPIHYQICTIHEEYMGRDQRIITTCRRTNETLLRLTPQRCISLQTRRQSMVRRI